MLSIKPQWCEKIASGEKTIEVRKSALKEVPFKAYIYCTKTKNKWNLSDYEGAYQNSVGEIVYAQQHVIGEFICNEIEAFHEWELSSQGKFAEFEEKRLKKFLSASCLSIAEVVHYRENLPYYKPLYGWHISDLKIYDKPKELREFRKPLDRVWCSYCNDYCDRGCISFGSTDYSCNDYWVYKQPVSSISVYPHDIVIHTCDDVEMVCMKMYGESWFLTEEEAKKRLEELENANM